MPAPESPGDNIIQEFGVFTPPVPLPSPADLSAGKYGQQLRYGLVNFDDAASKAKFNTVLGWLASFGVPVDNYSLFTPTEGGLGSAQIIFVDAQGRRSVHDATQLFNQPEVALQQLLLAFDLPAKKGFLTFPGFDVLNEQGNDPVGEPVPAMNTPGWTRPFARYYSTSAAFSGSKYATGERFTRVAADEEFVLVKLVFGRRPGPTPFTSVLDVRAAWERTR